MPLTHRVVKYEVSQAFGGPEEGGWWYPIGMPRDFNSPEFAIEENAYAFARQMNRSEELRAKREEAYEYHSVLSYRSEHFSYSVLSSNEEHTPYPDHKPHYE